MTTGEKFEHAQRLREEGYMVKRACELAGIGLRSYHFYNAKAKALQSEKTAASEAGA